jgi:hypothetical protein
MRAALALAAAGFPLLALAPDARSEIRVDVRVTEGPGRAALVEFRADRGAWVALYGSFSDGSLRTLASDEQGSPEWVQADELRVISVELTEGLHLESVQAVASPLWFDAWQLWIASAPAEGDGPRNGSAAGYEVSIGTGEGLWS